MTQVSSFPYEKAEVGIGRSSLIDKMPKFARRSIRGAWESLVSAVHMYGCRVIDDKDGGRRLIDVQPKWFLTTLKEATDHLYLQGMFIALRRGAFSYRRPVTIRLATLDRLREWNKKAREEGQYRWDA